MAKLYLRSVKPLRIAYLTASDPEHPHAWSGIHYSIISELRKHFTSVTALGPREEKSITWRGRIYSFLLSKLRGQRFDYSHSLCLAKAYGNYFSEALKKGNYDAVFAVAASTELAFLETDLPIFYTADATFANMLGYYPYYSRLTERSQREGHEIQQRALHKCAKLFFPSEWAAASASNVYRTPEKNISVVPYGANLKDIPAIHTPPELISEKIVKLLFVGVEWERKGGPLALEVFRELKKRGRKTEFTIVGCSPNEVDDCLIVIPFIDKKIDSERKRLNELFANAHFFILPTTAECFGLVFCEASAFGTPSLASATGGVEGAIESSQNGFLFPASATAIDYADKIENLLNDPAEYALLRKRTRGVFEQRLNWTAWGTTVAEIISTTTQSR
jgi:glycosyltransferase involved in cell wall biosynthesis